MTDETKVFIKGFSRSEFWQALKLLYIQPEIDRLARVDTEHDFKANPAELFVGKQLAVQMLEQMIIDIDQYNRDSKTTEPEDNFN